MANLDEKPIILKYAREHRRSGTFYLLQEGHEIGEGTTISRILALAHTVKEALILAGHRVIIDDSLFMRNRDEGAFVLKAWNPEIVWEWVTTPKPLDYDNL